MPNIEFHGFGRVGQKYLLEQRVKGHIFNARDLVHHEIFKSVVVTKVREVVLKTPYGDDAVLTTVEDECVDLEGYPAPFIRICDTDVERAKKIAQALCAELRVDIEILQLAYFEEAREGFGE